MLLREIDGYYSHHVLGRGKIAGVFRVFKDSTESWRIGINAVNNGKEHHRPDFR